MRFSPRGERWLLWLPVGLGLGVAVYFSLPVEPPPWLGAALAGAAGIASVALRRRPGLLILGLAGLAIAAGFTAAQARTALVAAPVLEKRLGPRHVTGRVTEVDPRVNGTRIVSGGAPHRRRRGCRHAGPRPAAYRLGCRGLACARALGHGPRGAHAAATAGGAGRLRFPTPVLFQKLGRRRLHLRRPRGGGPTRRPSRCREIRVAAMARDRAPGRLRESPRCARGADGRRGGGAPHRQARRHSARGHAGHARFGPGPSAGHLGPPSRLGRGAPVLHPAAPGWQRYRPSPCAIRSRNGRPSPRWPGRPPTSCWWARRSRPSAPS